MPVVTVAHRTLALSLSVALAAPFACERALAGTAADDIQVLELNYATTEPDAGLDLRPGRYLLQLRGPAAGVYEGLLRGPRNEIVAERIAFNGGSGCASGVLGHATLSARGLPGQPGLNMLSIEIASATGACALQATLPNLGLTASEKPPQPLECEPPEELEQVASTDSGPTCSIEKWDPPLTAPRPDLKPGRWISLAGRSFAWVDHARLEASAARGFRGGRCVFDYAYSVENLGRARSAATDASLTLAQRNGLQLDSSALASLAPGGTVRVQGQVALPPGLWQVFAHADSSARVGEWDGQNNARSLIIDVVGDCAERSAP